MGLDYFYFGLSEYLKTKNRNLIQQGGGGCPPLLNIDIEKHFKFGYLNCHEKTKKIYQNILNNPNIKTIYLAFRQTSIFRVDIRFIDVLNQIENIDNRPLFLSKAFVRTIKAFENAGKKVILLYDFPDLNEGDPIKCLMKNQILANGRNYCVNNQILSKNYVDYNNLLIDLTKQTNVIIFNTQKYFADFPINKNGDWLYRDETHLSYKGSMYLADKYNF